MAGASPHANDSTRLLGTSYRSQLNSYLSSSPIAAAAIAQDIEDGSDSEEEGSDEFEDLEGDPHEHMTEHAMMAESYQRPGFIAAGPRWAVVPGQPHPERGQLSLRERIAARDEERSLLRDNHLIPPKHPRRGSGASFTQRLGTKFSVSTLRKMVIPQESEDGSAIEDDEEAARPTEDTALLGDPSLPYGGLDDPALIDKTWEEAVIAGKIQTTWQRESKVLGRYSRSLIVTFMLQYSLTVASVFTVGHVGKVELGAVSLASMTANITGYAVYQGLATSLDTLCAQAYGSGHKKLVGLQMQRMVYFLWVMTVPIAVIWFSSTRILMAIVPEKEVAALAGLYLKILIAGAPGYALFESGKRFVQAQGLFTANLYVLLICAPLNAFLNWFFVWHLGWAFKGAPIAVAITENLMPLCLFLYVRFIAGMECWGGFERRALGNWIPMIKLAIPGLIMVLAEWLAFEILTLSATFFSTTDLAAQSVLSTVCAIVFQIPFPISIATSTRIANLIGATLPDAAKTAGKVSTVVAIFVGCLNMAILAGLKDYIPVLFTGDEEVRELVSNVLPICAAFQLFDAFATNCSGILRGLGRQDIGGYVNLFAYYVIALPISFATGFGLHWRLYGLWAGPAIGLAIVALIEGVFLYRTSWEEAVEAAKARNSQA